MCYIIRKYSWLLKITSKLLFPASKKSWNVILLSYVIIIFILCNRAKQNNFQKMNKKWWANREIYSVSYHQKILIPRCNSVIRISAIDRPEILVRFIRAKFSGWPRLKRLHWPFSSFDVLHIRYILYILYYGQSEPENANIRVSHIGFTIFTIGFITRSRCARTKSGKSGISADAGPHCEARVNGLKTFGCIVDYRRAHYSALTSSTDK